MKLVMADDTVKTGVCGEVATLQLVKGGALTSAMLKHANVSRRERTMS